MSDFEIEGEDSSQDFETSWIDDKPSKAPVRSGGGGGLSSMFGGGSSNKEEDAYNFEVMDYSKNKGKGVRSSYNAPSMGKDKQFKRGSTGGAVSKSTSAVKGDETALEKAQRMLNTYGNRNSENKQQAASGVRHKTRLPESYEDDYSLGSSSGSSDSENGKYTSTKVGKGANKTKSTAANKNKYQKKTKADESNDFSIELSEEEGEVSAVFSIKASSYSSSSSSSSGSEMDAFNERLVAGEDRDRGDKGRYE